MKHFSLVFALSASVLMAFTAVGCGKAYTIDNPGDDTGIDASTSTDGGKTDSSGWDDGGKDQDAGPDGGGMNDGSTPGDGGTKDGGGVSCKTSDECPSGYICPAGNCVPGCNSSRDCPDGWKCDTTVPPNGLCAKCIKDTDCGASGFKCVNHECLVSCSGDPDCVGTPKTPHCNKDKGVCVACTADSHCTEGYVCIDSACVEGCYSDRDCPAPLKCDAAYGAHGKCFECVKDDHCSVSGKVCVDHKCSIDCSKITCPVERPHCVPETGACVACIDKTQCKAGQVCRSNQCVAGCDIDDDCTGGWKCKPTGNGVCVECIETKDCPDGEKCTGNVCVTGGCLTDIECLNGYYCHPKLKSCEQLPAGSCKVNSDCNVIINTKICDPLTRTCIPTCYNLGGFPLCLDQTRIYCDTNYNGCYECLNDSECPGTGCSDFDGTCIACSTDYDCTNPAWHCDGISGACYECVNNSHCAPGLCKTSTHKCVQCLNDYDCTNASFPLCGKDGTCIPQCSDECVKDAVKCDPADSSHESYLTCGDWDNDPCLEYGDSTYCPTHQYCYSNKCICNPAPCTEGKYGCDSQYPTTVYKCVKDSNGCLYWGTYMTCTNGSKCGETGCP